MSAKEVITILIGFALIATGLLGGSWMLWFALAHPFAWHSIADVIIGVAGGFALGALGVAMTERL